MELPEDKESFITKSLFDTIFDKFLVNEWFQRFIFNLRKIFLRISDNLFL